MAKVAFEIIIGGLFLLFFITQIIYPLMNDKVEFFWFFRDDKPKEEPDTTIQSLRDLGMNVKDVVNKKGKVKKTVTKVKNLVDNWEKEL